MSACLSSAFVKNTFVHAGEERSTMRRRASNQPPSHRRSCLYIPKLYVCVDDDTESDAHGGDMGEGFWSPSSSVRPAPTQSRRRAPSKNPLSGDPSAPKRGLANASSFLKRLRKARGRSSNGCGVDRTFGGKQRSILQAAPAQLLLNSWARPRRVLRFPCVVVRFS